MNLDIELPSILKLERRLELDISDSKEVSWDGDNTGAELLDLDWKISSICCYLELAERLHDQWGILKIYLKADVSLSLIGREKVAQV